MGFGDILSADKKKETKGGRKEKGASSGEIKGRADLEEETAGGTKGKVPRRGQNEEENPPEPTIMIMDGE